MANKEMNIGLLSTAEGFGLVGEVLSEMGMLPSETEVAAIVTAGNKDGRSMNKFANRAREALSHNGFEDVTELDVQGVKEEEFIEQLVPADTSKAQLLVVTGGDKRYLKEHLDTSGAGRVVRRKVESGELAIVTISAGTALMGTKIEASGKDGMLGPKGLEIIPAAIICHFDEEKERDTLEKLIEASWREDTIVGIRDVQALVGKSGRELRVVGEGSATLLQMSTSGKYEKTTTEYVRLR